MWDFVCFRRMLTPIILQFCFWVVVGYCLFVGIYDLTRYVNIVLSLEILIGGPILARIITEILMLFFSMNENLTDIKNNTEYYNTSKRK